MKKLLVIFAVAFALVAPNVQAQACETGYSIESVTDDGTIVKLDDGSVWQVDDGDTSDSASWSDGDDIVVCNGRLINIDDNNTAVDAERLN